MVVIANEGTCFARTAVTTSPFTWGDGDTTQQCGPTIHKTAAFKEHIADKCVKKGPAIKKPS